MSALTMASEAPLHSCPSCPAVTDRDDLCINCDRAPAVDGFCVTCDPGPLLAEITSAHVSPEIARQTAAALLTGERGEIAAYLLERGDEEGARWVLARGRVSIG